MQMVKSFNGAYSFLSNFYEKEFELGGIKYKTAEHAFQALKSPFVKEQEWVRSAPTPREAKRRGRKVHLREDWDIIKDNYMRAILQAKFSDSDLELRLLGTWEQGLCEGNWWHDNYWGNCLCEKCKNIEGQNHLGKILMEIREPIINKYIKSRKDV